jgi:hypothetical protein
MRTNILWSGREYYSLENCVLQVSANGIEAASTIIGYYQRQIYRVDYIIRTNAAWQTLSIDVRWHHDGREQRLQLESDGRGNWKQNGEAADAFTGCIDVDLPLTPFTNTLPVNRLQLAVGEAREIRVLYLDLLAGEFKPVRQKYKRLSATTYHYENVPNDFEADIEVDEAGLVVDYPQLFVRTAIQPCEA